MRFQSLPKSRKLLVILCILGFSLICLAIGVYIYRFGSTSLSDQKNDWDLFSTYISAMLGPIIGLLTLLITSYIAFEFNDYQKRQQKIRDADQLQQTTIELFKEWRSASVLNARTSAWKVKRKWEANDAFKPVFIEAMIMEMPTQGINEETSVSEAEFRAIYDMFAFYNMLSLYSSNEKNIRNLNYFSYPWWRRFLYQVAIDFDAKKSDYIFDKSDLNAELYNRFKTNISFTSYLKRLDRICGFVGIDKPTEGYIFEFYKKPYG